MAMSALYGLVTICLFGIALAAVFPGPCPDMKTMPDFELSRFTGRWYEFERYTEDSELDSKCVSAAYTSYNDSTVEFESFKIDTARTDPLRMNGILNQPNPAEPGQLVRSYTGMLSKENFWILETNYDDFAVIYSCTKKESYYDQSAWILTREQFPRDQAILDAVGVVKDRHIDLGPFKDVNQTNCPAWKD